MKADIERAAAIMRDSKRLTVLTGAGVSKESGIPTFRDAQTGIWANYNPETLATPEGFLADPSSVWRWYDSRRQMLRDARPNPGHYAIAKLQEIFGKVVVVTQNIDGLHEMAGSQQVFELHGSISKFYCFDNKHPAENIPFNLSDPPLCSCGSLIRPAVVWFGEALPENCLQAASAEIEQSDVLLVVGTSGLVQPAASLPYLGKKMGAKIIEINPDATPITPVADISIAGASGAILPQIVELLTQSSSA